MTTNDILKRLRYILNYSDQQMIGIFQAAEINVNGDKVKAWLAKEESNIEELSNQYLAYFLDGLINTKRGKRTDYKPKKQTHLSNNDILKKLKIALKFTDQDIIDIMALRDVKIGKHELSAFLRHPTQGQYKELGDQYLRKFLSGLQTKGLS